MKYVYFFCLWLFTINNVKNSDLEFFEYLNRTQPAIRQIYEFKVRHPVPIGVMTTSSGKPVDIRETTTINSDAFSNLYHVDLLTNHVNERIPERIVHAKGGGAFGYFEVTHDVSMYTKADLFNGIGKKTPVIVRFSSATLSVGGNDLTRDQKGIGIKFYTNEGNFDLLCLNFPVFFLRDAVDFPNFIRAVRRNPKTFLTDVAMRLDFATRKAESIHSVLWLLSDFGIPNGYRKIDAFPIHTYEINNKYGDRYFVKFNFRTQQGLENLPVEVAAVIAGQDPDYFNRDLYNAIENKEFPVWTLEMDVMSFKKIQNIDYDPFDETRVWKNGTYRTVEIGRLVLNQNSDNYFRDIEQVAYNPSNLVPGIRGAIDVMFRSRISAYRETQIHRLGVNHNKINVNKPQYVKVYNRDGVAPVRNNMKDVPNYYPNSFNGPIPNIDISRPKERISVYQSSAVDLEPASDFYNNFLQTDDQRQRLVNNAVSVLVFASPELQRRAIRLFTLVDQTLGARVTAGLQIALQTPRPPPPIPLKFPRQNKA